MKQIPYYPRNYKHLVLFAGGSGVRIIEFKGYVINEFNLKIADPEARLDSVRFHISLSSI